MEELLKENGIKFAFLCKNLEDLKLKLSQDFCSEMYCFYGNYIILITYKNTYKLYGKKVFCKREDRKLFIKNEERSILYELDSFRGDFIEEKLKEFKGE